MRLISQKAVLLALLFVACRSTTEPERLMGLFTLENINGRALPTYLSPTPGLTPTIVSATLNFQPDGTVFVTELRRNPDGSQAAVTTTVNYTKHGNEIEMGNFWICALSTGCDPLHGTIIGQTLSLVVIVNPDDSAVVYNYRMTPIAL